MALTCHVRDTKRIIGYARYSKVPEGENEEQEEEAPPLADPGDAPLPSPPIGNMDDSPLPEIAVDEPPPELLQEALIDRAAEKLK